MEIDIEQLKYPIGKFKAPENITDATVISWINELENIPARLRDAVSGLNDEQLNTPYRPGGWTLRQVVHHLPDSHMNAYIRFKLAITEDNPTIKPYFENRWAECEEAKSGPIEASLDLFEALHKRLVLFLRSLDFSELNRTYLHPELNKIYVLKNVLAIYAWHGEHHLQHILKTRATFEN